jgi:organic hydroperoxide reductase OsmC/OhrA
MVHYPLLFKVSSHGPSGTSSPWQTGVPFTAESGQPLTAAIPPEFAGPGGGYSPEDFYALALINCFIATFKVIAERSKLEYETIQASGTLTVDRDDQGAPWMKHFLLEVELGGARDPERAGRLLEKASQSCLILNSVRTGKEFRFRAAGSLQ